MINIKRFNANTNNFKDHINKKITSMQNFSCFSTEQKYRDNFEDPTEKEKQICYVGFVQPHKILLQHTLEVFYLS